MGGGYLGFLALVVTTTVYATLSNIALNALVNPGASPNIPVNSTGTKQTLIHYKFNANIKIYHMYLNINKALK